jgi:hypothetical protein
MTCDGREWQRVRVKSEGGTVSMVLEVNLCISECEPDMICENCLEDHACRGVLGQGLLQVAIARQLPALASFSINYIYIHILYIIY